METTEATQHGDDDRSHRTPAAEAGRPVRVGYVAQGFGPALVVDDGADGSERLEDDADGEARDGLLRVGDAVVTLEIPLPDGRRSVLSWDPSEVTLDPLVA